MLITTDLLLAKQQLSGRLLRVALHAGAAARAFSFRVDDVVAAAGRNVHAVGVGRKIVEGRITDTLAVRIYVAQKIATSLLSPRDKLPESIDGVPVDVIESPPAFLMTKAAQKQKPTDEVHDCTRNRRKSQRPVVGGISAAHYDVTAGTISCFCRSTRYGDDPSQVYVMSNNHVFANVNQSHPGDDLYQLGPADSGTGNDHFAELHRFVEIKLGGSIPNRVDAAIGHLLPGIEFNPQICSIGTVRRTVMAEEGMRVRKHGRTTGYTEGSITDPSYDSLVGMDHADPDVLALFEDQISIERVDPYSSVGLGGDSGSLIVNKTRLEAVGLYFAGPPGGEYGVANQIADVLTELQVALIG